MIVLIIFSGNHREVSIPSDLFFYLVAIRHPRLLMLNPIRGLYGEG